jgi:hypothetical protein
MFWRGVRVAVHAGAALLVDELTTLALVSLRSAPGVSLSLSIVFLKGCKAGDVLTVKVGGFLKLLFKLFKKAPFLSWLTHA